MEEKRVGGNVLDDRSLRRAQQGDWGTPESKLAIRKDLHLPRMSQLQNSCCSLCWLGDMALPQNVEFQSMATQSSLVLVN